MIIFEIIDFLCVRFDKVTRKYYIDQQSSLQINKPYTQKYL